MLGIVSVVRFKVKLQNEICLILGYEPIINDDITEFSVLVFSP